MNITHMTEYGGGYFEAEQEGAKVGRITYSNAGSDKFIIDHTEVKSKYQGHGIGTQMVRTCVEYARENNLKIVPLCSFARSVFVKYEEIRDVLYS